MTSEIPYEIRLVDEWPGEAPVGTCEQDGRLVLTIWRGLSAAERKAAVAEALAKRRGGG